MSNNLRLYTKALYGMDHVVRGVSDDRWDAQSPCAEWTAAEVLLHASGALRMTEQFARGHEVETPAGGPRSVWNASRDGVLEALDQPGALQKVEKTPFGEMPIDNFLGLIFVDTLGHSWDLARATGGDERLAPELVSLAHATLQPISAMLRAPGRFDEEVPTGDGDDEQTRFIKFLGRQP